MDCKGSAANIFFNIHSHSLNKVAECAPNNKNQLPPQNAINQFNIIHTTNITRVRFSAGIHTKSWKPQSIYLNKIFQVHQTHEVVWFVSFLGLHCARNCSFYVWILLCSNTRPIHWLEKY